MICPSCQTENPEAAKFCFNCGHRFAAVSTPAPAPTPVPTCRECQATLPVDARFCGFCGTRDPLTEAPADPQPASTPVAEPASPVAATPGAATALAYDDDREDMAPIRPSSPPGGSVGARLGIGRPASASGVYAKHGPSLRARRGTGSGAAVEPAVESTSEPDSAPATPVAVEPPPQAAPMPVAAAPGSAFEPGVSAHYAPPVDEPACEPDVPAPQFEPEPELFISPIADPEPSVAAMQARTRGGRAKPRPVTQPQKAVFASPRPEMAAILAAPDGWPDITDELAEIRFASLQDDEQSTREALAALRERYPGHPEVEALVAELGGDPPPRQTVLPTSADGFDPPAVAVDAEPEEELATVPFDAVDELDLGDVPQAPLDEVPTGPREAAAEVDELDVEIIDADDLEEIEDVEDVEEFEELSSSDLVVTGGPDSIDAEPDFLERTMAVQGYQPPAPYKGGAKRIVDAEPELDLGGAGDGPSVQMVPGPRERATLAPDGEARPEQERSATLAPHESATTLAPSEYRDDDDAAADELDGTTLIPDDPAVAPTPRPFAGSSPSSPAGMTTPDTEADAAASGEFRVVDLDLDEPPAAQATAHESLLGPEQPTEPFTPGDYTADGTVVARAPLPPAPFGQREPAEPVAAASLVMLGGRGQPVAQRHISPGDHLDIGRRDGEPWGQDQRMSPLHARVFPAPGGVVVDDFGGQAGVYSQIFDTIAVHDGDEFKVGQARLALRRLEGPAWGELTVVRHDRRAPEVFVLDRDVIEIGRDEGDVILPNDTFVSGDHCRFIREGNAIYLEDRGSSNGTYVRVRAGQCVAFGGLLLIGHTQFKVHQA